MIKIAPLISWLTCILAACLLALAIWQTDKVAQLNRQLATTQAQAAALAQSNALLSLRLDTLEAKDPAYTSAKIIVAWDPRRNQGVISLQNLPPPPAGRDYQLWVLDPKAPAPVSAGVLTVDTASRRFTVGPIGSEGPGFAVSLEPSGGQPAPSGPILFAVPPDE